MRTRLASVVAVVAAMVATAAADSATPSKTYLRMSAQAQFYYELDYGSDPRGTFNGTFSREIRYAVNAIAVFDGRSVSIPGGLMVVQGYVQIREDRTKLTSNGGRVPVTCKNDFLATEAPGVNSSPVATFSTGRIAVSNAGLSVDPGPEFKWNTGCTATESPQFHRLPGGPSFRVSAPSKARFRGTADFSIGCQDSYSHPFKPAGNPNGHSFTGQVQTWVRFTPFPASKLAATKTALRDTIGEDLGTYRVNITERGLKDC